MQKKKILILVEFFLPGYKSGGPIQAVANLIRLMKREYEFYVLTKDRDFLDTEPYPDVVQDTWVELEESCWVYYLSEEKGRFARVKDIVQDSSYDLVYIHTVYNLPLSIWPLLLKWRKKVETPYLVAPRGIFNQKALSNKSYKKKPFLTLMRASGIQHHVTWHASSQYEREDIKRMMSEKVQIKLVPDSPTQKQAPWASLEKEAGKVKFVFMARVTRMKNLTFLLDRMNNLTGEVQLDIYGPREDKTYWEACQTRINQLPTHVIINYKGQVKHPDVAQVLRQYHFFTQPSLGENFGHSIFEALIEGKPILISDQTPWLDMARHKAGWDLSLDQPDAFVQKLQFCIDMTQSQYDEWSQSAWLYAKMFREAPELLEQNRDLLS